jgi:hypothetical protein
MDKDLVEALRALDWEYLALIESALTVHSRGAMMHDDRMRTGELLEAIETVITEDL